MGSIRLEARAARRHALELVAIRVDTTIRGHLDRRRHERLAPGSREHRTVATITVR
ncbi:MAG TPA: hypothetical protein VEO54_32290 [Thermoanaerobaculia bacterium]|nr:hypothetical protein [Thermoanaerobaculia bacterium]